MIRRKHIIELDFVLATVRIYLYLAVIMATFETVYRDAHASGLLPGVALLAGDKKGIDARIPNLYLQTCEC